MNNQMIQFAKTTLKEGLAQLPETHQRIFKRMCSPDDLELPISNVIDNMSEEKLDWAMQQVERSLIKLKL